MPEKIISNMQSINTFFQELYKNFNERKIDSVIAFMTENVQWANGMEGGYVHGHDEVRAYWTRQFKMMSANVTPLEIKEEDGKIIIEVQQVVHDLDGNLLADELTQHIFILKNDKIAEFHISK